MTAPAFPLPAAGPGPARLQALDDGTPPQRPPQARPQGGSHAAGAIVNALTVDVEDYFQVSALAPHIPRSQWEAMPCRVEANVERLLALFDAHGARATFFTLGWVAERYPLLVRRIVQAGHELASHGYGHLRASEQSPADFTQDIVRARALLQDIGGVPVRGYRAPSFSIGAANLWAFDCIAEAGYTYSSSVYPVQHDHYGMPEASRFPFKVNEGLVEVPITTVQMFGRNLPAGGGGYFRFLPYALSHWAICEFNRKEGRPALFYMHPWEIDPGQPRVPGPGLKTRFRHYVNLHRTEARLQRLLHDFRWGRMDQVFGVDGVVA
jgi:polysaccharide deacetylase family protein (PEP-CTERM system associated)